MLPTVAPRADVNAELAPDARESRHGCGFALDATVPPCVRSVRERSPISPSRSHVSDVLHCDGASPGGDGRCVPPATNPCGRDSP